MLTILPTSNPYGSSLDQQVASMITFHNLNDTLLPEAYLVDNYTVMLSLCLTLFACLSLCACQWITFKTTSCWFNTRVSVSFHSFISVHNNEYLEHSETEI